MFRSIELAGKIGQPCRTLDPSCGSGTFLVAALRRELAIQDRLLPDDRGDATQKALSNIIGFDINPVAVLMSRINLLLSLGERIEDVSEAIPQVYQTDSILLPDPLLGQQQTHQQTALMRLPLTIGAIDVPEALTPLDRMRELRRSIELAVRNHRSLDDWRSRIRPTISSYGIPDSDVASVVETTAQIYQRIAELNAEGRNGVWARVIEQAFAPVSLERAEMIVGNPPWINWKHLPDVWQERSESIWKAWGLWSTKARGGGIPLSDVAFLLLARCIATYAQPGAMIGFLVPESLLIGDPGNECIRRCDLRSDISPDSGISYCPVAVDDWTEVKPFSRDATNKPIAIYVRTREKPEWPMPKTVWKRGAPRLRLASDYHWSRVSSLLKSADVMIGPIEATNTGSPWVPDSNLELLPKGHSNIHYTWGQGLHTHGVDGWYTYEILSKQPDAAGLVLVRTSRRLERIPEMRSRGKEGLKRSSFGLWFGERMWIPFALGNQVSTPCYLMILRTSTGCSQLRN